MIQTSGTPKLRVERKLAATIIGERAVGHFNEEKHVGGAGVIRLIVVGAGPQQHEIGFGFVISVEPQRVLDADKNHSLGRGAGKQPVEPLHEGGVRAADGVHVDDLPVDQFDAVVAREDAGLGHFVIGVDVEPMPRRRLRTLKNFAHEASLRCASVQLRGLKRQFRGG